MNQKVTNMGLTKFKLHFNTRVCTNISQFLYGQCQIVWFWLRLTQRDSTEVCLTCVTHLKRFFFFQTVLSCRCVYQSILWNLNMYLIGWQFTLNLYYICWSCSLFKRYTHCTVYRCIPSTCVIRINPNVMPANVHMHIRLFTLEVWDHNAFRTSNFDVLHVSVQYTS